MTSRLSVKGTGCISTDLAALRPLANYFIIHHFTTRVESREAALATYASIANHHLTASSPAAAAAAATANLETDANRRRLSG